MRIGTSILCVTVVLSAFVASGETDAESVYQQGLEKLRASQSDHAMLVPATKLLAKAAEKFDVEGNESLAAEANSCLYWARKKLTLADTATLKGDAVVTKRFETVAKPVAASEAQQWLQRADTFAKNHADDPLLVAIQYFAVADRFKDSDSGREAMDKSLKAMQAITAEKPKPAVPAVPPKTAPLPQLPKPQLPPGATDLLAAVTEKDARIGTLQREANGSISTKGINCVITSSQAVPDEYDMTATFVILRGRNRIVVEMVHEGRSCNHLLEIRNQLKDPHTIIAQVRKKTVTILLDGRQLIRMDPKRLVPSSYWDIGERVGIGTHETEIRLDRFELSPPR